MYESMENSGQWKEIPNRYDTAVHMSRHQIGGIFSVTGKKAKYLGESRNGHEFIMQEDGQYKNGVKVSVNTSDLDTNVRKIGDWKKRK